MKSMKTISAAAILAAATFSIAGSAIAAGHAGGHSAGTVRMTSSSFHSASTAATQFRGVRNRRFAGAFPAYPYSPYGYGYGNQVYLNRDEADWSEQWQSLYQDNDGPYARSTRENPLGGARMWEFNDDQNVEKVQK